MTQGVEDDGYIIIQYYDNGKWRRKPRTNKTR